MSVGDQIALAEMLRRFLLEFASLPVKPGQFNLDGLMAAGKSMSLQITGGQVLKTYIDGTKRIRLPFTLFYRSTDNVSNDYKSSMIGSLNAIGDWLDSLTEPPFFGDSFKVIRLEQVQTANIIEQLDNIVTYQAGFALDYETVS